MLGFYTIPEGQRIALWDDHGRRTIMDGPQRFRLRGRRIEPLKPFVAGPAQYLVARHRDGRIVHQRGPAVFWKDPVEHLEIGVENAITLDANEALVVYRQEPGGKVQRRIVRGPELFVPEAQEWLHQFRWHGADPDNPRRKIPRGLVFNKLRVIPDQMYFDVESVRTADDALLVVKLMVFFELIDIGLMLDQTHDPIADFINAVTADVIDFAAALKFEQFKDNTNTLNARETYPQLAQRAGRIGYRINKVVYRGYEATAKLQAMHDGAIETRTRLKLESETESQAQELADLKLAREHDRAEKRQAMEREDAEHAIRVKRLAHDEQLRQEAAEHEARLRRQTTEHEMALAAEKQSSEMRLADRRARYEQRVEYLKRVQDLQVDMTRYLVARHEKPDRRIRVDGDRMAQLHLHEQQ
jgi:hypothetical protein